MLKLYTALHYDWAKDEKEVSDEWLKKNQDVILKDSDVIDISAEPYYDTVCYNAEISKKPVICLDMDTAQWQISRDYSSQHPHWEDICSVERKIKSVETGENISCLLDCENKEDENFFKIYEKQMGIIGWY